MLRNEQLDPRDLDPREFMARVESLGHSAEAARRLMSRVVGRDIFSPGSLNRSHQISRQLCDAMGTLPRLRLVGSAVSPIDKFRKLAFATPDDLVIETVLIPLHKPGAVSVCLSSQ